MLTIGLMALLVLIAWWQGGSTLAVLVLLGLLVGVAYYRHQDPRRKIRQLHKDAWKKARDKSQTYYDKVRSTTWR